eukprot:1961503-Rhodomonas_salina.1
MGGGKRGRGEETRGEEGQRVRGEEGKRIYLRCPPPRLPGRTCRCGSRTPAPHASATHTRFHSPRLCLAAKRAGGVWREGGREGEGEGEGWGGRGGGQCRSRAFRSASLAPPSPLCSPPRLSTRSSLSAEHVT